MHWVVPTFSSQLAVCRIEPHTRGLFAGKISYQRRAVNLPFPSLRVRKTVRQFQRRSGDPRRPPARTTPSTLSMSVPMVQNWLNRNTGTPRPNGLAIEVMASSPSWCLTSPLRSMSLYWRHFAESTHTLARQAMSRFCVSDLSAHASMVRCANGRAIYINPQDGRGRSLVRRGGDVNPGSLVMWRSLLAERPWTHVIDVGANYGEMLVGVELPRAATVIALEPNPFVIPYLTRTLQQLSGVGVELMSKAASARSGTATLAIDRNWSGLSSIAGVHTESA